MSRQRLSVVVPVYNEERQIGRFLDAVKWADEVIVVDTNSSDRTAEIAALYQNVRFLQCDDYIFAKVNYGLEQATGDWILKLDADEIVSPELAAEIQRLMENPQEDIDGYWVPNRVYFFGKWIKYGVAFDPRFGMDKVGLGHRQSLWKKGFAWHDARSEHEEISTKGNWGVLTGHYSHYSHRTVSQWIQKMNYYTDRDIERTDVLSPGFKVPSTGKTMVALPKIFWNYYVSRMGYKDGVHGFMVCALNTAYVLVWRCKVWEKHYRLTRSSDVVDY